MKNLLLSVFLLVYSFSFSQTVKTHTLHETWFDTMLENKSNLSSKSEKNDDELWRFLRLNFTNHQDLMQMSWEERDKIWDFGEEEFSLNKLGNNYIQGYMTSCNERGIQPRKITFNKQYLEDVIIIRNIYLDSRSKEYLRRTPAISPIPKINGPSVFGVRPGHPLLFKIPVSGERPIKIIVSGLPSGAGFNEKTGVISGSIDKAGDYELKIDATNNFGSDSKSFLLKVGETIALTPPMGWNSWNSYGYDVTAKDIYNTADNMIKSGLADFGWSYINIDDCWMKRPAEDDPILDINESVRKRFNNANENRIRKGKIRYNEEKTIGATRDAEDKILPNLDFPDMKKLTDYIHSLGLRAGLYTSPGPITCQCYSGSYGHEYLDAQQFADWGFDYLKYDWCGYWAMVSDQNRETLPLEEIKRPYKLMGEALINVNRDIVYSLCQYGMGNVWEWGKEVNGNLWRTAGDFHDYWEHMVDEKKGKGFFQDGLEAYAGPGHWNDPDMMAVGYVGWGKPLRPTYFSPNEQYSHVSLWCLFAAPLMVGADLTRLDDFTLGLLTNREVLDVNQDLLGKQGSKVLQDGKIQVWLKQLSDGSLAVGIFNLGDQPLKYKLEFDKINLNGNYQVRDIWKQKNIYEKNSSLEVSINRHDVMLVKLIPKN